MDSRVMLIGLSGPAGCGKSTAAERLEREGFRRLSFADPIRATVLELFPFWGAHRFSAELKELECGHHRVTPRQAMRVIGDHGRRIDPEAYVVLAARALDDLASRGARRVVIDDVRFPNEAAWVREIGGAVAHIHRPGWAWSGTHGSEVGPGVELGDYHVHNPGSEISPVFLASVRGLVTLRRGGVW